MNFCPAALAGETRKEIETDIAMKHVLTHVLYTRFERQTMVEGFRIAQLVGLPADSRELQLVDFLIVVMRSVILASDSQ